MSNPTVTKAEIVKALSERYKYTEKTIRNYLSSDKFTSRDPFEVAQNLEENDKLVKVMKERGMVFTSGDSIEQAIGINQLVVPVVPKSAQPASDADIKQKDKHQMVRRANQKYMKFPKEKIDKYGPHEKTKSRYMSLLCAIHEVKYTRMHYYVYGARLFDNYSTLELVFMPKFVEKRIESHNREQNKKLEETMKDLKIPKEMETPSNLKLVEPIEEQKEVKADILETDNIQITSQPISEVLSMIDKAIEKREQEINSFKQVKTMIQSME